MSKRNYQVPATVWRSKTVNLVLSIAMAWAWGMFCAVHILAYQTNGDWSYLLFGATESLAAILFLIRSEPVRVSQLPLDWALAIGATFLPMLFTPTGDGWLPGARILIVPGALMQIGGLLSLNRSLGMVAAHRQIKTSGLYRMVRHPLYASYLLSYSGYLLANTSDKNIAIFSIEITLLLARLICEERFLSKDPQYLVYMQQVKYRVIPRLF
jgi:protein-S-isoprenylcysteine O-methyltransferase Ste14